MHGTGSSYRCTYVYMQAAEGDEVVCIMTTDSQGRLAWAERLTVEKKGRSAATR